MSRNFSFRVPAGTSNLGAGFDALGLALEVYLRVRIAPASKMEIVALGVECVLVIPEFEVSTEKARAVLPQTYSRKDAVYNLQRSALIVGALTTGNWPLLREAMKDRIHQPYRISLIPGFEEILDLQMPG